MLTSCSNLLCTVLSAIHSPHRSIYSSSSVCSRPTGQPIVYTAIVLISNDPKSHKTCCSFLQYCCKCNEISLTFCFNPLNANLNPICYLLALLAHNFLHVSRIRVKLLTLRLLMSYIYIYIYI